MATPPKLHIPKLFLAHTKSTERQGDFSTVVPKPLAPAVCMAALLGIPQNLS